VPYIEISPVPENFEWYMIVDIDSVKFEFYGDRSNYNRTKNTLKLSDKEINAYYEKYIENATHGAAYMFKFP
jgi:hypothetical protein